MVRSTRTLVDRGDTASAGVVSLVVALVLLGGGVALVLAARGGLKVVGALLAALGGYLLLTFVRHVRTVRRLEPGALEVPHDPAVMGAPVELRFSRGVKRGAAASPAVRADLRLREWVRYRVGTDVRTATEVVWTRPLDVEEFGDPTGVAATLRGVVPALQPTFAAANNRTLWEVVVIVRLADGVEDTSTFELPVGPSYVAP